ncbi:MAG: hypothetical protein ACOYM8_10720 [Caulobacterales bacterium]
MNIIVKADKANLHRQPDREGLMLSVANVIGSRTPYFSHLIEPALPEFLETATCIYFDGVAPEFRALGMLDLVENWFAKYESKPKVVLVASAGKSPRYTLKSMRSAAENDAAFRGSFDTIQFFPKGRTTIDDTWRPSVYFAFARERQQSAFFCVNRVLNSDALWSLLQQGHELFRACATYGFWFPERFSPLGYYWGISVEPGRRHGAWGKQESRRLSHWRDNTSIGISSDGGRRFFGACDGYVRDAYPLMLLSRKHVMRRVGRSTLAGAIEEQNLGSLTKEGEKFLWRIPTEKLADAQKMLDGSDVSLSGRRFE